MSDSASHSTPAPVESADDFLAVVQASGLVDQPRRGELAATVAPWRAAPGPMPAACRQALIDGGMLTDWQIRKLLERAGRAKFFIDKFKLLQPLGQGGMGSVYLAEYWDPDLKQRVRVAIKLLPKKLQGKGQYIKRFNQESWVAASLNHPNIARAQFDFGDSDEDSPYHYSVMDYIEGVDLDRLVRKKGPLSAQHAAEFIMQAALGLQHAHDRGLVHRDIKPANLMVDAEGTVKILDFGLVQEDTDTADARVLADLRALKADERKKSLGTPDYMSPEQAEAKAVDRRSDIYSLGCTLYFVLTGHAPFDHVMGEPEGKGTRVARMEAHIGRPAPNLLDRRPNLPPKLVELSQRMMAKAPGARPQSAQEVADDLFVLLAGDQLEEFDQKEALAAVASGTPPRATTGGPGGSSAAVSAAAPERPAHGTSATNTVRPAGSASSVGGKGAAPSHSGVSPRHADTPPPSSSARSTLRMPPAARPDTTAQPRGGTAGPRAAGSPHFRQPVAGARAGTTAPPHVASPAGEGWAGRRLAGLPIAGWLAVAAAVIVLAAAIVIWSLVG